jgi:hypothetical protein
MHEGMVRGGSVELLDIDGADDTQAKRRQRRRLGDRGRDTCAGRRLA